MYESQKRNEVDRPDRSASESSHWTVLRSRLSFTEDNQLKGKDTHMKVHWFSVLSVTGIVLLAGNVFGNELQWKTPSNRVSVPSVTHIPAVISTDDTVEPSAILQVQGGQRIPPLAPPVGFDPSEEDTRIQNPPPGATIQNVPLVGLDTYEMDPQIQNPPPGAAIQKVPPLPPQVVNKTLVQCNESGMLKSIKDISYDIRPNVTRLPNECALDGDPYYGRHFSQTCFTWKASALSTKAAYFEDAQLERHGHTKVCPALQPVVSGAKFFVTVPFLPYKMGVTPPNECVYTLGHYRMGSCAPYMREPIPISARGALFQAGAILGGTYVIP